MPPDSASAATAAWNWDALCTVSVAVRASARGASAPDVATRAAATAVASASGARPLLAVVVAALRLLLDDELAHDRALDLELLDLQLVHLELVHLELVDLQLPDAARDQHAGDPQAGENSGRRRERRRRRQYCWLPPELDPSHVPSVPFPAATAALAPGAESRRNACAERDDGWNNRRASEWPPTEASDAEVEAELLPFLQPDEEAPPDASPA